MDGNMEHGTREHQTLMERWMGTWSMEQGNMGQGWEDLPQQWEQRLPHFNHSAMSGRL
jgi:hypothetical protein